MGIFQKNKNTLTLVLNIGSSNAGGALFWAQESGIPKIIFSVTEPIILEDKIDTDRFLLSTMQALDVVVNKIFKSGMGIPKDFFCVLSSPWHVSQTRIINLKKDTPFVFTAKLAESLVQKEIAILEKEQLSKADNSHIPKRTIELKNIRTILNGYETSEPLDHKVQELEMTIFVSISEEQVLQKVESTVAKYFHFNQIRFFSFTLASFTVVRDVHIQQENFLLLDVDGEVTNISMIKKNILRESISFPIGSNFLVRGVANDLLCTLAEANSFLSLFRDGHAETSVAQKISLVMDKLKAKWLKEFQESLANISNDISIPSTIYMTTEKSLADFFCQTIKTEQFNQYTLTESKFETIFLNAQEFHGIAVFADGAVGDSNLIIDSIYINRFLTKI